MGVNLKKQTEIVLYVCRIRFSTFPSYYFPLCMLITYNRLRKLRELFEITSVPNDFIEKCLETCNSRFCDDINNCVLVNKDFLNECGLRSDFVRLPNRKLAFLIGARVRSKTALVSETFKHNLKDVDEIQLKGTDFKNIPVAKEIDLSLINTNHDLSNALIDGLVKNYFRTPKFVHRNDLIAIKFRKYAPEVYYTSAKFLGDFVHFRCNNAIFDGSEPGGLCVVGETTIKQSANCQSYVAPSDRILCEFGDDFEDCAINRCPFGLNNYLERLERIVNPFLRRKQIDLKPVFLLKGTKGSGKTLMVATLASKYGLHFYSTGSFDINSTVYAQTETKIRNIFFKAKLSSPCVLAITNFENFGKNNEGQYDERIINFFKTQLDDLFANNPFPIILMCISNAKEIPSNLGQIFLETIEMSGPDENQRLDNLKWILRTRKIAPQANLEAVARKTRGFLFEDLRALVFHAQMHGLKNGRPVDDESFDRGLDLMQSKYNQGLGAPKIPKVQWSDVGGLADVKREIIRTINLPLRHPELLQNSGLKRSGILLYGPPGTGKTLMAKAVATECNLCFLSVKGPELLNMYVGQSEHNVREVFERAREASPCIIFFDELDSLAPNRGVSGDSGGVMDRVVSQLLAEMDGLDQGATVFIIGATNRPDLIDPALLRPGRFDKLLYVGPCVDFDSKLGVLEALTRKFNLGEGVDLKQLIAMCPENITGADFYGLSSNAWLSAVRHLMDIIDKDELLHYSHDDVIVTMEDFKFALRDLKPSLKTQDLAYFEQLQKQFKN